MQYNLYLQSDHWQERRKLKLLDKPLCQICKSSFNLNIHHKKYNDKNGDSILFHEKNTRLITLCASCHRFVHKYFGIDVKKINKKICRVRRLLELGSTKKMAFYIAANDVLFISLKEKNIF